ncbi:CynX/NimT family MFS transporter [Streptomyces sp. NPDC048192]|uniref:CynX/NimT family MFS transporter n=1 Tax=Streptomyces sp. NPDC048192 TaxID=3365510 RepID=UPI00371AA8BB
MRPAIVAVSPLLDDIRASTGISNAAAGILSTLPLVCFGIFAPMAPRLARHFGMEHTLFVVLVVLLGGVAVRLVPSLPPLFLGTFLVGTAVAIANVVVTAIIKRDFHQHVGLMSGLHSTMLVGGGALAAGLTIPLRDALSSNWTRGLAVWGVLALLAIAIWAPRLRRATVTPDLAAAREGQGISVWRDRLAWAVALFYAFQSLIYYTATTWLPTFYTSHGASAAYAGSLLSICFGCAIVTSLLVPIWAQRSGRQSYLAWIGSALCVVGLLGLIVAPTAAPPVWSAILGLGLGAVLSLGITFMSMRAEGAHDAGLLSAMSQCVGYLVAAAGPVLFGFARDTTHAWTVGLIALVVAAVPMAVAGAAAGRGGHVTSC